MNNINLVLIVLFLSQNIYAQVNIHYEKQLTGRMHISDIGAINVTNFTGVDIDYIYKGWAMDANDNIVIKIKSNVLTQPKGSMNYNKNDKFDSWKKGELNFKISKYSIDTSSYSGALTYYSELVHPLDTLSIIARNQKKVHLKNGFYATDNGKLMTDPRLLNLSFDYKYNEKFVLDSLFGKIRFDNKNEAECCQILSFEILQDGAKIYASNLGSFCADPGISYLTEDQIKALNVSVNTYNARSKTSPIKVRYRFGESSDSRSISNISHSDFDFSAVRYTHHASGLSFDYINSADVISNFEASSFIVEINEDNTIERYEMLGHPGSPGIEGMKMYHPFFTNIMREDYNGSIAVLMLHKENFTAAQWRGVVSFTNNVDQSELTEIQYKDITIIAPKALSNMRKSYGGNRVRVGYAFIIIDQETVTLYDASYYKLIVENPDHPKREKLDLNEALKSIHYNGIQLGFSFENEVLKGIEFEEGKVVTQEKRREQRDKMRRYHHLFSGLNSRNKQQYMIGNELDINKLDQKILDDNNATLSDIPQYIVSTPNGIKNLETKTSSSDSLDLQVSYRSTGSIREQIFNRVEKYDYEELYKIESSAYMMKRVSFSSKSGNTENNEKIVKFASIGLDINSSGQQIEISKLDDLPMDTNWIIELVRFQNLTHKGDPLTVKTIQVDGLTFYVPVKTLEKTQWQKEKLCIYMDSGQNMYRLNLILPSVFDRNYVLNNMLVEGKQYTFNFEGSNIVGIDKNK